MALSPRDITLGGGWISLLDTMRGYFVRYRLALYLFSAVAVALERDEVRLIRFGIPKSGRL